MKDNIGYITQVIGPVVDATFDGEGAQLPPISQCAENTTPRWLGPYRRGRTSTSVSRLSAALPWIQPTVLPEE